MQSQRKRNCELEVNMEVQKKNYLNIERRIYDNLVDDRCYLEAVEKILEEEIKKKENQIIDLYEENLKRLLNRKAFS